MTNTDRIERTISLPASRERVWAAVTDSVELAKWFAPECTFELKVGADMRLVWESGEVSRAVIEEITPPQTFAFRWHAKITPFTDPLTPQNSTRVTFTLTSVESGTELRVVEEGLLSLPTDARGHVLKENTSGWIAELNELIELFGDGTGV